MLRRCYFFIAFFSLYSLLLTETALTEQSLSDFAISRQKNFVRVQTKNLSPLRAFETGAAQKTRSTITGPTSHYQVAESFMTKMRDELDLQNPDVTYKVLSSLEDTIGMSHVRMQQMYRGLPIFGSNIVVHISSFSEVRSMNGTVIPIEPMNLRRDRRRNRGFRRFGKKYFRRRARKYIRSLFGSGRFKLQHAARVIVNPSLFGNGPDMNVASWMITLAERRKRHNYKAQVIFISEKDGSVIYSYNPVETQTPIDRLVADCSCTPQADCCVDIPYEELNYISGRTEGTDVRGPTPFDWTIGTSNPTLGSTDTDELYDHLGNLHDYVYESYGRDGGNDLGGTGTSADLLTYTDGASHAEVSDTTFGIITDGCTARISSFGVIVICTDAADADIVGHEYGHSIANSQAWNGSAFTGMITQGETGALEESYCDFMGELYEKHLYGTNDWLHGTFGNRISRRFDDPTLIPSVLNGFPLPDRFHHFNIVCSSIDSGGIHLNLGVPNKAIYLTSVGGDFNGCQIDGIGIEKVEQIWYRAVSMYFSPSESFNQAYESLQQACADLYSEQDCHQLEKALQAVEMNQPGTCSGLSPDPYKPACHFAGDYNCDSLVDINDYQVWRSNYGSTVDEPGTGCDADGNDDGVVDAADYSLWRNNLGVGISDDLCPQDQEKAEPGICGCGIADDGTEVCFQNGDFEDEVLEPWEFERGLIRILESPTDSGNHVLELISFDDVTVSQPLFMPAESVKISFDAQFITPDTSLELLVNNQVITTITGPTVAEGEMTTFMETVTDSAFLAGSAEIGFRFIGGEIGNTLWLDNITVEEEVIIDLCPEDMTKTEPGICGCGIPDDGLTICFSNGDFEDPSLTPWEFEPGLAVTTEHPPESGNHVLELFSHETLIISQPAFMPAETVDINFEAQFLIPETTLELLINGEVVHAITGPEEADLTLMPYTVTITDSSFLTGSTMIAFRYLGNVNVDSIFIDNISVEASDTME